MFVHANDTQFRREVYNHYEKPSQTDMTYILQN